MSRVDIQNYRKNLAMLRQVSGTGRESVVREAFKDLLKNLGREHGLHFVAEYQIRTDRNELRFVDGALLHELRVPFGYWEAKDDEDDLDKEIADKFRKGYPQNNILFEDSTQVVLIQDRKEVARCAADAIESLENLLQRFFSYRRPEIAEFQTAIAQFYQDLPNVLHALRAMIVRAESRKPAFRKAAVSFLEQAQNAINPSLGMDDVREMLIQHILTEEIFSAVFPGTPFHQDNNVAKKLYGLEGTFFTGNTKYSTLKALEPYYAAIRRAAAIISSHHEKQTFLKTIYENFYKIYNPKAADRLGVVYTPNEIVRFIVENADRLCEKHFNRNLIDRQVHILDPAVGTGTFVSELLEHFRGVPEQLEYKYKAEIHANEVAILPYYVANLNIEATFASITGTYEEYPNLCFVDTLDNTYALRKHKGHMGDLFGAVSEENIGRIKYQNSRQISVVLGNPPYNANQLNENENNKNRAYPEIDKRIKETYIAHSEAQKTKLYDMYARFFRWASDRLDDNGIIAFVTNNSFLKKKTFDGFRKTVAAEFDYGYIVDLGGEMRDGDAHGNVFGITVGVAISFWVRKEGRRKNHKRSLVLKYTELARNLDRAGRLSKLKEPWTSLQFRKINSPQNGVWFRFGDEDFDELLPIASKKVKAGKRVRSDEQTIFRTFSLGLSTNRDEWVYDFSEENLLEKVKYLNNTYTTAQKRYQRVGEEPEEYDPTIKWSRNLKRRLKQGRKATDFNTRPVHYRPFVSKHILDSSLFIDERGQLDRIFLGNSVIENPAIVVSDPTSQKETMIFAVNGLFDLHLVGAGAGAVGFPLRIVSESGELASNITPSAVKAFRRRYKSRRSQKAKSIQETDIFNYTYAVLIDPIYREKYRLNLKEEFPKVPFYDDFWKWSAWGKRLIELHTNPDVVEPFNLIRKSQQDHREKSGGVPAKPILKSVKCDGIIRITSQTWLEGVPEVAWDYVLGARAAIDWVLDQYKERKPRHPMLEKRFNRYRFDDYEEQVVGLIRRVTTVSVETVKILTAMRAAHSD